MRNSSLKKKIESEIESARDGVKDIYGEIKDIENSNDDNNLDLSYVYKYLDDLNGYIENINDSFYDFSNEVDNVRDKLDKLF